MQWATTQGIVYSTIKPQDWLDQPGKQFLISTTDGTSTKSLPITEEQRAFIVAALRAFDLAVCKKCGGVSWDVPLADYCRCQQGKKPNHSKPHQDVDSHGMTPEDYGGFAAG